MQAWGTNLLSRKSMCLQAHCTACTQLCGPSEGILHSAWLQALLSETHKSKAQAHWVSPIQKVSAHHWAIRTECSDIRATVVGCEGR